MKRNNRKLITLASVWALAVSAALGVRAAVSNGGVDEGLLVLVPPVLGAVIVAIWWNHRLAVLIGIGLLLVGAALLLIGIVGILYLPSIVLLVMALINNEVGAIGRA